MRFNPRTTSSGSVIATTRLGRPNFGGRPRFGRAPRRLMGMRQNRTPTPTPARLRFKPSPDVNTRPYRYWRSMTSARAMNQSTPAPTEIIAFVSLPDKSVPRVAYCVMSPDGVVKDTSFLACASPAPASTYGATLELLTGNAYFTPATPKVMGSLTRYVVGPASTVTADARVCAAVPSDAGAASRMNPPSTKMLTPGRTAMPNSPPKD